MSTQFKCQKFSILNNSIHRKYTVGFYVTIDRTSSGITILDQSEPGSDGNEGVLCIPQRSSITEASTSDCLMSYPGNSLVKSYSSADIQSVYSAGPAADWALKYVDLITYLWILQHP